jgi:hypothetical protein
VEWDVLLIIKIATTHGRQKWEQCSLARNSNSYKTKLEVFPKNKSKRQSGSSVSRETISTASSVQIGSRALSIPQNKGKNEICPIKAKGRIPSTGPAGGLTR